jgi:hypothetical protein
MWGNRREEMARAAALWLNSGFRISRVPGTVTSTEVRIGRGVAVGVGVNATAVGGAAATGTGEASGVIAGGAARLQPTMMTTVPSAKSQPATLCRGLSERCEP